jgi:hypothetical protein
MIHVSAAFIFVIITVRTVVIVVLRSGEIADVGVLIFIVITQTVDPHAMTGMKNVGVGT